MLQHACDSPLVAACGAFGHWRLCARHQLGMPAQVYRWIGPSQPPSLTCRGRACPSPLPGTYERSLHQQLLMYWGLELDSLCDIECTLRGRSGMLQVQPSSVPYTCPGLCSRQWHRQLTWLCRGAARRLPSSCPCSHPHAGRRAGGPCCLLCTPCRPGDSRPSQSACLVEEACGPLSAFRLT